MIARELTEFFATFAPYDAAPRIFGPGDPTFLSNVNAAYRRACWAEIRFEDVAYSEDQAFGRALAAHPRWRKVYHPGAGVLHAHDYAAAGVHAPLLRRVPRPARDDRPRRAVRLALDPARRARARRRRPALHARARARGRGARPLDGARRSCTTAGARCSRRSARARTAARRRPARAVARGRAANGQPRRRRRRPPRRCRRSCIAPARARPVPYEAIARALQSRPGAAARPYPGMADRERLHIAFVDPDRSTSGRAATTSSSSSSCGSSAWATRARCGSTTCSATARTTAPAVLRREIVEHVRAGQGAGLQGLRALVRRRRGRRHRLADCLPGARARRGCARARLPHQRPRAGVLRDVGRVRVGRAHVPPRASTASPAARGCATSTSSATAARPASSSTASTTTSTSRGRSQRRARHRRRLRPRRDAAPRGRRSRMLALDGAAPPPAGRPDRPVRQTGAAATRRSRSSTPASSSHEAARLAVLGGDRRPVPVADELLADAAGDARLRAAVRGPRPPEHAVGVRRRRPGHAGRLRRRTRSPTRSSACSTTRPSGSGGRGSGSSSFAPTRGTPPPSRSSASCETPSAPRGGACRSRVGMGAPVGARRRSLRSWPRARGHHWQQRPGLLGRRGCRR